MAGLMTSGPGPSPGVSTDIWHTRLPYTVCDLPCDRVQGKCCRCRCSLCALLACPHYVLFPWLQHQVSRDTSSVPNMFLSAVSSPGRPARRSTT